MSDFDDPLDIGEDFDNDKLEREKPRLKSIAATPSAPFPTCATSSPHQAVSMNAECRCASPSIGLLGGSIAHDVDPDDLVLQAHFACQPYVYARGAKDTWSELDAALPTNVARMYLGWKGEWRLPLLNGMTTAPILSEDGGIRTARGYDAATGFWCEAIPDVADLVPRRPSRAEAEAALWLVRDFFKTFCFADAETLWANGVNIVDLRKSAGLDESSFLTSLLGAVCRPSLWLAPGLLFRGAQLSGSGLGRVSSHVACARWRTGASRPP